ncbi:MAG: HAD family phosphatase [Candidatus Heimdallarchaeota archaeon]|nr:HAD family phosphatase [Candidatus Heimdallarchaeota archaeon]
MVKQALILDCDGVIVDSEPFSCGAWNVVFETKYQIDIGTNYNAILGKKIQDSAEYYLSKYNIPRSDELVADLIQLKEQAYIKLAQNLQPVPGVKELIAQAKQLGWKIAVASSGSHEKIRFSLGKVDLLDVFDEIISGDDVQHGKPAPDLFLKSIAMVQAHPSECVIVEDSVMGVTAAKKSGAYTVGLVGTFPRRQLTEADLVIDHFHSLNLVDLLKMQD